MEWENNIERFGIEYRHRLKPGTLKIYKCAIRQFYEYCQKTIVTVTKSDIRTWLNDLTLEKGFKPSTMNNKIAALKMFYMFCYEEEIVSQNPTLSIKFVMEEEKVPRYLTMEQLNQLRYFLERQIQERAIVEVLYTTGIRISELIEIKIADIDWSDRLIIIPEGKGNIGRIVLFTQECAAYLKAYLESRTDSSPLLFLITNTEGENSNSNKIIEEWFRYYSMRLGFKVTPHTLRHTFAAHLSRKGMPLECLQELMGHEDYKTTRIYARLYDHARKEKYDEVM